MGSRRSDGIKMYRFSLYVTKKLIIIRLWWNKIKGLFADVFQKGRKVLYKVIFDNITDFTYFSTLEAYKKCFVFKEKDFFDSLGGELINLKVESL